MLDSPHDLVDAVVGAEAGREPMAAAAFGLGDAADVDLAEGPEAHADSAVGLFLDTHVTSASAVRRRMSMRPSTSSIVT